MTTEEMMMKFPTTRKAWKQAGLIWKGLAIPCKKSTVDGEQVDSEKVLKFNRKALVEMNKIKSAKADPRLVGGDDTMIIKVAKPGDRERVEALAEQYGAILAHGEEISPFGWRKE